MHDTHTHTFITSMIYIAYDHSNIMRHETVRAFKTEKLELSFSSF